MTAADLKRNGTVVHEDSDYVLPQNIGTDYTFKRKIVWFNAIGFLVLHLAGIYGMYLFTKARAITMAYTLIATAIISVSVTMGAHRLYSHKAFEANFWVRFGVVFFQTMSGQNCLYIWVRDHRQHHKYSDTDADPHNANRGFFFSHVGWLMSKKHPLVIEKGKTIDMSDLEADPLVMFQKTYYKPLYALFAFALPIAIPVYFWGETLWNALFICYLGRYIFSLNGTWSINSATHLYGTKPYDKDIKPVENRMMSYLTLGEGWHNYHHAFPWDYRAAEFGLRYSPTTAVIDLLAYFGWAYNRRTTKTDMVKARSLRKGDGTHPHYGNNNTWTQQQIFKDESETIVHREVVAKG